MKRAIGAIIVLLCGLVTIIGFGNLLTDMGYSGLIIYTVKIVGVIIVIATPLFLIFSKNSRDEDKLGAIGGPVVRFFDLIGASLSSTVGLTSLILIIILNIFLWK